jgi:hypothetical protein
MKLQHGDYEISEVVENTQEALEEDSVSIRDRAIELFFLIGGRHHYGGIAVTFIPTQKGKLVVQVPISAGVGLPFDESLTGKLDVSYKGLPKEYMIGVFEGLMKAERTPFLGGGILRVKGVVHGRVGSSKWIFRTLGHIVVKLLTMETEALSETAFTELIQAEIR